MGPKPRNPHDFPELWGSQDPQIAPREPKRAILGAQDSPKIAPESHLGLSWGCLGAIKSPRYAQDSTKIAPRVHTAHTHSAHTAHRPSFWGWPVTPPQASSIRPPPGAVFRIGRLDPPNSPPRRPRIPPPWFTRFTLAPALLEKNHTNRVIGSQKS